MSLAQLLEKINNKKDAVRVDILSRYPAIPLTAVLLDNAGESGSRASQILGYAGHGQHERTRVTQCTLHKLKSRRFDPLGASLQWVASRRVASRHGKIRSEFFGLTSRTPENFNSDSPFCISLILPESKFLQNNTTYTRTSSPSFTNAKTRPCDLKASYSKFLSLPAEFL